MIIVGNKCRLYTLLLNNATYLFHTCPLFVAQTRYSLAPFIAEKASLLSQFTPCPKHYTKKLTHGRIVKTLS